MELSKSAKMSPKSYRNRTAEAFLVYSKKAFEPIGIVSRKTLAGFMKYYYLKRKMSTGEIMDLIKDKYGLEINFRIVNRWLKIAGVEGRSPHERFVLAIKKKRMDYKKRQIDYTKRHIDYKAREEKKRLKRMMANST